VKGETLVMKAALTLIVKFSFNLIDVPPPAHAPRAARAPQYRRAT
jgi:hypothetical protein